MKPTNNNGKIKIFGMNINADVRRLEKLKEMDVIGHIIESSKKLNSSSGSDAIYKNGLNVSYSQNFL